MMSVTTTSVSNGTKTTFRPFPELLRLIWSTRSLSKWPKHGWASFMKYVFGRLLQKSYLFFFCQQVSLWWISFDTLLAFFHRSSLVWRYVSLKYQKYFCRSRIFYATLSATALRKYSSSTHFFAFSGLFQAWRKIDLPSAPLPSIYAEERG